MRGGVTVLTPWRAGSCPRVRVPGYFPGFPPGGTFEWLVACHAAETAGGVAAVCLATFAIAGVKGAGAFAPDLSGLYPATRPAPPDDGTIRFEGF